MSLACIAHEVLDQLRVNVRDYLNASVGLAPMERTIGKLHFRQNATLALRRARPGGSRD